MRYDESKYNRMHIAEQHLWDADEWIVDRHGNLIHAEEIPMQTVESTV